MDGRRANGTASQLDMNRLYMAEGVLSVTGSAADHRLPVSPSRVPLVGLDLAAKLAAAEEGLFGPEAGEKLAKAAEQLGDYQGYTGDSTARWINDVVQDLLEHKGRAIVAVGERQPPALHALGVSACPPNCESRICCSGSPKCALP